MKKMMNKKIVLMSMFISLALLLFGCGGQTEQTTETAAETSAAATETASENTATVTITEEANNPEATVATGEPTGQGNGIAAEIAATETTEEETAAEAVPQTVEVNIQSYAYDDAALTIKAGDTVVWTNYDSAQHTVTATSGADFDSGKMSKDDTWSYTFTEPGTYEYYCTYHPSMTGTVVVE